MSDEVGAWFHQVVATMLSLAKSARPVCIIAVAYLATRVTNCDADDVDKLCRLVRYVTTLDLFCDWGVSI